VYGIFLFIGIAQGAFMPSAMNMVYDFAGEKGDNKLIMALIDSTLAPFTLIAIVVAGIMAEMYSTIWIFTIIAVMMFVGLFLLVFMVKDPKDHSYESMIYVDS